MPRRRTGRLVQRLSLVALFATLIVRPGPAPATVAEQRARLPPAAECDDPIEGTWLGLSWYPNHRQWYEFTLEIRRTEGSDTALTGTILAHWWDGTPDVSEPGACRGTRIRVREPAEGTFAGGKVQFGGTSYAVDEVICGDYDGSNYAVDVFKGTLDPALEEFQSVNDWNASSYDEPTVFRRIKCAGAGEQEPEGVRPAGASVPPPPPFQPRVKKRASGGC
jgi:hypothetical protein